MEQGTNDWFAARCGKATASKVVDILPGKKGAYLAGRKNYLAQMVCERMTGTWEESFTSGPMQWGTDTEPLARSAFEAATGIMVTEDGFKDHATIENFGCSPDGLIYKNGKLVSGLEIKCPNTATHFETLKTRKWKPAYTIQMHVAMMCYDVPSWWFESYDPRAPEELQLFYIKVTRDDKLCEQIEMEVRSFNAEVEASVNNLKEWKL